jgi:hypothetical protein
MKLSRSFALLVSHVFLGLGILGILISATIFVTQNHRVQAADSPAFVRVIHASPDIGTADVFVDGSPLLSAFQFGAVTGYVAVPTGAHKIQIALVGKGINSSVLTQTLTVTSGIVYTVAATGTDAAHLALDVFIDDNQLAPDSSKVRIYQLSPNAGSVEVATSTSTLVTGLAYQGASDYLTIPSGSYQFDVSNPSANLNRSIGATLVANKVTSIFAIGLLSGTPPFELVSAQVDGVPGLPNTGSDPNAPALSPGGLSPMLWLIGLLSTCSFLFLSGWGYMRLLARKLG